MPRNICRKKGHFAKACRAIPTTFHVTVECTAAYFPPLPPILRSTRTPEQWEGILREGAPRAIAEDAPVLKERKLALRTWSGECLDIMGSELPSRFRPTCTHRPG
ncbi:hypothetical protein HPB52_014926 [Rhipicephalus sanguineus]|uniref:Uncharacterized protein n=1 Tax=Rhipicephalus sanguineus TaxID=34632 RepID=A0A9D4SSF3_RHISA|nr:hypothetical protein HPB52_014926 [Rhipicephalus sanguineus]